MFNRRPSLHRSESNGAPCTQFHRRERPSPLDRAVSTPEGLRAGTLAAVTEPLGTPLGRFCMGVDTGGTFTDAVVYDHNTDSGGRGSQDADQP